VAVSAVRASTGGSSEGAARPGVRYSRESLEHARLVNLSDAVFAIAMTLLAFKVDAPEGVTTFADLAPVLPQALAFLLSFAIVANFWWHHHRLLARIEEVDPHFVLLNLALLGAVALVPFPTELIGGDPGEVAPAVVYLGLMLVITGLIVLIVHHAERASLWRHDMGEHERREHLVGWGAMLGLTALALVVALWWPLLGLAFLLLTGPVDALARRRTGAPRPAGPAAPQG
jgi:uncharacterized membrane protein